MIGNWSAIFSYFTSVAEPTKSFFFAKTSKHATLLKLELFGCAEKYAMRGNDDHIKLFSSTAAGC
jgi:hypothetical protein